MSHQMPATQSSDITGDETAAMSLADDITGFQDFQDFDDGAASGAVPASLCPVSGSSAGMLSLHAFSLGGTDARQSTCIVDIDLRLVVPANASHQHLSACHAHQALMTSLAADLGMPEMHCVAAAAQGLGHT